MSLRVIHMFFILAVIIVADLFGAWAATEYFRGGGIVTLVVGLASFGLGLAAVGYFIWFVRKAETAKLS